MKRFLRIFFGIGIVSLLAFGVYVQFGREVEEARADVTVTPWPPRATTGTHLMVDTFTASGTWTVPAGVTSAVVEAWGAGGNASTTADRCGGGGAYVRSLLSVTPGDTHWIQVGSGQNWPNSPTTTFATTTVVAAPGKPAKAGGAGGSTALSTGNVEFAGGAGNGNSGWGGGAGDAQAGQTTVAGRRNGATPGGSGDGTESFPGGSACDQNDVGAQGLVKINYSSTSLANFPYVNSRAWTRAEADVSSLVISMPSGTQSGDLLLAVIGGDTWARTINCSPEWSRVESQTNTVGFSICTKTANGSDSLTATTTSNIALSAVVYSISGWSAVYTTSTENSGTTINPRSLDTGASGKYLWIAGGSKVTSSSGGGNCYGTPTGFRSLLTAPAISSSVATYMVMAEKFEEGTTVDPGSFPTVGNCTNLDTANTSIFTIAIAGIAAPASSPTFLQRPQRIINIF